MAHTDTYIDGSLPFSIARVANVTGNPMQDIGYQCRDSRPYFGFAIVSSLLADPEFYTTLAPAKATTETTVNVYTLGSIEVDGVTYDAMTLVGTGTQNGTGLVYNSFHYSYKSNVAIREFNINKWAKYKPQAVDKLSPITDDERKTAEYPYGLEPTMPGNKVVNIHEAGYEYAGVPGSGDVARLTDFAGYNHAAELGISADITVDEAILSVTFKSNPTEGALTFAEVIEALFGYQLSSCYPILVASMMDEDGENIEATFLKALTLNGSAATFTTEGTFTADFTEAEEYEKWRKWKLTIFFAEDDGSVATIVDNWVNASNFTASGNYAVLPGATGVEMEVGKGYLTVEPSTLEFNPMVSALTVTVKSSSEWACQPSSLYFFPLVTSGTAGEKEVTVRKILDPSESGTYTITFTNEDGITTVLTINYKSTYLTVDPETVYTSSVTNFNFTVNSSSSGTATLVDLPVGLGISYTRSFSAGQSTFNVNLSWGGGYTLSATMYLILTNEDGETATITFIITPL